MGSQPSQKGAAEVGTINIILIPQQDNSLEFFPFLPAHLLRLSLLSDAPSSRLGRFRGEVGVSSPQWESGVSHANQALLRAQSLLLQRHQETPPPEAPLAHRVTEKRSLRSQISKSRQEGSHRVGRLFSASSAFSCLPFLTVEWRCQSGVVPSLGGGRPPH